MPNINDSTVVASVSAHKTRIGEITTTGEQFEKPLEESDNKRETEILTDDEGEDAKLVGPFCNTRFTAKKRVSEVSDLVLFI